MYPVSEVEVSVD